MSYVTVFYAGMVHSEHSNIKPKVRLDLPEGCYIFLNSKYRDAPQVFASDGWYRKDLTPVLLEDVPKELRVLQLILS